MIIIREKKLRKNIIKRMTAIFLMALSAIIISMGYVGCEKVEAGTMTWEDGSITAVLDDDGVLTISGSGAMTDYTYTTASQTPWYSYRTQISKIVVEEGITHIGGYSFKDASVEEVSLPESLITIGDGAFYACGSLREISIPDNVVSIGATVFAECAELESISLGESVESIGTQALRSTSIKKLYIPQNLNSLGEEVCLDCVSLETYEVSSGNSVYSSQDGVLFNKDKTLLVYYPGGKSGSYVIPNTVTEIGDYAFIGCSSLTNITIPDTVITIGGWAFYECSSLVSLTIPDSVISVGTDFANGCVSLKSVTLGSGIETLENSSFRGCSSLTKVTLKEGLEIINMYAFSGCTSLASLTIPDSVTRISAYAFDECTNLSLTLPSGLRELEDGSYILADDVSVTGTLNYSMAYEALDLINEEREEEGLSPLTMDKELLEAAMQRASEISVYFSHTRPSGESWSTAFSYSGSESAGENIAAGYNTASRVVAGWMNSSGHKSNILGSKYTSTGIGCFKHNGTTYWVQVFSSDSATSVSQPSNVTKSMEIEVYSTYFSDYIYLSSSASSLVIGKTATFKVCITNPGWTSVYAVLDADSFTWSSGSTSVASVNQSGVVTGKGAGSAVIGATSETGCLSVSSTISVTCATPTISSISNTSSGVKISWSAINGASKYQIWRKASSGSWTKLGTTTSTSYTDKTAKGGTSYYYRLRCVKSDGSTAVSSYSSSKCIMRLANATISSLTNVSSGITVKWGKITGANGYYIYRRTSGGSYSLVKTITSGSIVSYTDTAVKNKNGTTYLYYVIPYYKNSSGVITKGTYANTKTTVRLTAVSISSVSNSSSKKVTVKWAKNSKATGYQIMYSTSSSFSSYKTVTVTGASSVSKVISSLTKGKTYYVRIRAYKTVNSTKYYSAWSSKKSVKISK